MIQRRLILAGLGAGAFALAGCGGKSAGTPVLRVGSQKGGTKALILASGVLEGAPYTIQWSEFGAAQPLLEAIGAGAVDLGAAGDAPFLFAYASGGKVRAVQASRNVSGGAGTAILVGKASPARTVADLRGRRVATGRGSIGHYVLLARLQAAGVPADQVTVVFLSPGDAKAAFSSGAIDAWVTWGSYVHLAKETEGARVLADGLGILSGYGFEVANPDAISTKRPQIEDFLHRLARAQRWAGTNQSTYAAVLAKETGLNAQIAALTAANYRGEPVPIDATVVDEERRVLAQFRAAGAIAAGADIAPAFDASFNATVAPSGERARAGYSDGDGI